jgi:diguanylate cyclase (GGDEF)-like protein/PAS domain S-box-containing protein
MTIHAPTASDEQAQPSGVPAQGNHVAISPDPLRAYTELVGPTFSQSLLPQAAVGLDLRIVIVNDAFAALLGTRRSDLIGVHVDELAHENDPGSRCAALLSAKIGDSVDYERIYRHADGSGVPVRVIASVASDASGDARMMSAFVVDLTAQRAAEMTLRRRDRLFQALVERASDVAVVIDATGLVIHANTTVAQFGYTPEQVVGTSGLEFVHPDDRAIVEAAFQALMHGSAGDQPLVYRHHHADGKSRWVEGWLTNHITDPDIGGVVVNLRDVTARIEASHALQASEDRYRAIVETAQEGIWLVDQSGRTVYTNARLQELTGRSAAELEGAAATDLSSPEGLPLFTSRLRDMQTAAAEQYEVRYAHPDGQSRWFKVAARALYGSGSAFVGSLAMISDVTATRLSQQALRQHDFHDILTGLPNRAMLQDCTQQSMDRLQRKEIRTIALLIVDIDDVALVNDMYGHEAGDRVIEEVAKRLSSAVRSADLVARPGGDEFVVLAEDLSESDAVSLAERLAEGLAMTVRVGDAVSVDIQVRVGVSTSVGCLTSELLQAAEAALRAAKSRVGDRVELYDQSRAAEVRQRFQLSADLRTALANDGLDLHYQPIVDLTSGRLVGLEALARWDHPRLGVIAPAVFVSIAEESGFITELDRWVLLRAMTELSRLREAGHVMEDVRVCVNISARHLTGAGLEAAVAEAVWLSKLPFRCLALEITETEGVDDWESASAVLDRLAELGVESALDDFGTGYCSLTFVKRLPVTKLKIDQTFVENIVHSADDLAIVASVVDLTRALRMTAVAEGVESVEQLSLLQQLGCHSAQGFLWSGALPARELAGLLESNGSDRFDVRAAQPSATAPARKPAMAIRASRDQGLHRLLELHRDGASLQTIASALNSEGYRTAAGTRWHPTSVATVITHHVYPSLWPGSDQF